MKINHKYKHEIKFGILFVVIVALLAVADIYFPVY